jgi:cell division septal protein FtsQ
MTKKKKHSDTQKLNPLPWIAAALFVLGLAVVGGIYWDRTGKIKEIKYEGNYYTSRHDLQQIAIPTGVHPDSLDLTAFIKKYENINYVKSANIKMNPGGTMIIAITERRPLALLIDGGSRTYVDGEGVLLQRVLGKTPDVPILYGFKTKARIDTLQSESFKITSQFLQELHQRPAADATISEVAWTNDEGIVALSNENGMKLIFGKGEFDKRLRNWQAFYGEVIPQKGTANIKSIDLRFKGQIVTREKE